MTKVLTSDKAPAAIGPYSQGIITYGDFVFTSGQLGLDAETGEFAGNTAKEQAIAAFKNIEAILVEAGTTLDDVVKTTCFLQNMDDFAEVNKIYEDVFKEGKYPARSAIEVAKLPKGGLVEIEAIAIKK